jgi:hypothetical protein
MLEQSAQTGEIHRPAHLYRECFQTRRRREARRNDYDFTTRKMRNMVTMAIATMPTLCGSAQKLCMLSQVWSAQA